MGLFGLSDADALLTSRDMRLGASDLGLSYQIAGVYFVHLLLWNQTNLALRHVQDARVRQMCHVMSRLSALQFVVRRRQFGVGLLDCGLGSREIILHFRDFKRCEQLPFSNTI